jgi:hypothetical protein
MIFGKYLLFLMAGLTVTRLGSYLYLFFGTPNLSREEKEQKKKKKNNLICGPSFHNFSIQLR